MGCSPVADAAGGSDTVTDREGVVCSREGSGDASAAGGRARGSGEDAIGVEVRGAGVGVAAVPPLVETGTERVAGGAASAGGGGVASRVTVPLRLKFCSSRGPMGSLGGGLAVVLVVAAGAVWASAGE